MQKISTLKRLILRIKYPKLILFGISLFFGFLIYTDENNFHFHILIQRLGLFAPFLAGIFFSHGMTVGPAVAILLLIGEKQPIVFTGLVTISGSLVGSFLIFQYLRISYSEEVDRFSKTELFRQSVKLLDRFTPTFIRIYILPVLAGVASALPFPDELAMSLVHASKNFSFAIFSAVSLTFNLFGIFIILWLGKIL